MTAVAIDVYGRGLAAWTSGQEAAGLAVEYDDGSRYPVPVRRWCGPLVAGDSALLTRAVGPTLDVGCGPGRLLAALGLRGVPALGIDICAEAVVLARRAGGHALRRDVFRRLPGEGRWSVVLLADGNIGIGGDPTGLLQRARDLVAPGGRVLVELDPPGARTRRVQARLHGVGQPSSWFAWAHVGADDVVPVAAGAHLDTETVWKAGGRWFGSLVRPS